MSPTSCKHYNGDHHNKTCLAGVCYRDVTTNPDDRLGSAFRKPCVDWEAFNKLRGTEMSQTQKQHWESRGNCDKFQLPTKEELASEEADFEKYSNKITMARDAILDDLRRRWLAREPITSPTDLSHFYQPQKNYYCGSGVMDCPICRTGKLSYSRSTFNGHIRARCSTSDCVGWVE